MKIHAFFRGLLCWSLCIASPLCADSDFVQKMLGLSEEQMRAYWQGGSEQERVQKVMPEQIQSLAQEVENEKLKTALGGLKEVVADSESSIENYEAKLISAKNALLDAQKSAIQAPPENLHHVGIYGKIKNELVKASIALEHKKTMQNGIQGTSCSSSKCSIVQPISFGPATITSPGHYCVTADINGGITIAASNVTLSLDLHTVVGLTGIIVDGGGNRVSNVKICGSGVVNGVGGIVIQEAENVTIDGLFISAAVGLGVVDSIGITVKNTYIQSFFSSFDTTRDIRMQSCSFTPTDPTAPVGAITYFEDVKDLQVDDCFFDDYFSVLNIVAGDTTQSLERVAFTNCLINNCLGDAFFVLNASEFAIRDTLIGGAARGVALQNVVDFQMQNSQILNTRNQGLEIVDAVTNVEVEDCQFLNTGLSSVEATHLMNGLFSSCTCSTMAQNPHAAMSFTESQGISVENSILSALLQDPTTSGTNGIVFQDCRGFSLMDSIVETNARGIDDNGGSDILIAGGSFGGVIENCILKSIQPNVATFGVLAIGANESIRIENNTIDGAVNGAVVLDGLQYSLLENNLIAGTQAGPGVTLRGAVGVSLFGNTIVGNATNGVFLDSQTINCTLRDNTISKNGTIGLNNQSKSKSNKIYHNFALSNVEKNYSSVSLVAEPDFSIGVLENISN